VHGGLLDRRCTAVDAHVLGDLILLRYGKCRDVTGAFRDQAAPLVPQVRLLGCQPDTLLLTALSRSGSRAGAAGPKIPIWRGSR
jgi:hypothetical protein